MKRTILYALYNAMAVPLLHIAFFLAALVSKKARLRRQGLKTTWKTLAGLPALHESKTNRIWFHAASMGEFEQLKPIIEHCKSVLPSLHTIVSFFSPSGYEHQRQYPLADAVVYLPLDGKRAMERFVNLVQPSAVVIARYDLWWNMLLALKGRSTPTFLVCATLNSESLLAGTSLGREYLRAVYGLLTQIFTAGSSETVKFEQSGITAPITTSADTRFDRIASQVASNRGSRNVIAQTLSLPTTFFSDDDCVLVVGSSWKPDEDCVIEAVKRLEHALRERLRLIIVPHEPNEAHVRRLKELLPESEFLSAFQGGRDTQLPKHCIVDSIGKLLKLYALADIVVVGGGFGSGVHSVTEPAGYGLPIACGGNIGRARDAEALHAKGSLTLVRNSDDIFQWLQIMLQEPETRKKQGAIAHRYVHEGIGWSRTIAEQVLAGLGKSP
ncbi:MAG: 3-deoxy-D-manno-octulosonic acid transferase [Candidatus Kapaibacteriota bacterium]